jgi:hypothetical protein
VYQELDNVMEISIVNLDQQFNDLLVSGSQAVECHRYCIDVSLLQVVEYSNL